MECELEKLNEHHTEAKATANFQSPPGAIAEYFTVRAKGRTKPSTI